MYGSKVAIVLNSRFDPDSTNGEHSVGAAGFIACITHPLAAMGGLAGFVLYRRLDHLKSSQILSRSMLGYNAIELQFNFGLSRQHVTRQMRRALLSLAESTPTTCRNKILARHILPYYQSSALLKYHPPEFAYIVTHHAPFVSDVVACHGRHFAEAGFQGGQEKVTHLSCAQESGIRHLRGHKHGTALEISKIQSSYLIKNRVPVERVALAPPPISVDTARASCNSNTLQNYGSDRVLTLVTCAARIDAFKNLELLIDVGNKLLYDGYPIRLLVAAGATDDGLLRNRLFLRASDELRRCSRVMARMPHRDLSYLLYGLRKSAIFVFPSKYETLGITPIEAALSGMTTIVGDMPEHVGVSGIFPTDYRVTMSTIELSKRLKAIMACDLEALGSRLRNAISARVGTEQFLDVLSRSIMGRSNATA